MDVVSPSSANFLSAEVSKFWLSPILSETVNCRLLKNCKLPLCPLFGGKMIPPIRTGFLSWGDLTEMLQSPGGGTVPDRTAYMLKRPDNPRTSARRARDGFCCQRRHDIMRRQSTSRKPIINLRIHCRGDDWEGPVTQNNFLWVSVSSVRNFSFLSVTSVSSYLWIAFRISFCIIRVPWVWFIISSVIDCQTI